MPIAITEDHLTLGSTAADFLAKHGALAANRALLEADEETLPAFWSDLAQLGWLGLHLPEDVGGSGFGAEELVVVVEELGRVLAPGPFVPTVVASTALNAAGSTEHLAGLADGSITAGIAVVADLRVDGATVSGHAPAVLSAGTADLLLLPVGDDLAVVAVGDGVTITTPKNLDPSRRSSQVTFDAAPATILTGAAGTFRDAVRLLFSAEAVGVADACTLLGAEYAKERLQFGRPIAMYQGVKHHCANMAVATQLATSAVWDAARAAGDGGDQAGYAAAVAATLAAPAANLAANLSTQVHGGIAITWEHDLHLYMRRATVLLQLLDPEHAADDVVDLARRGVSRERVIELPPEAETIRAEVRTFLDGIKDLDRDAQRTALTDSGYAMSHWPTPFGRAAGAVEQIVIEQELQAAQIKRPSLGITAWNILTIIQHGNADQVERWVRPALNREVQWCQLFSEPDAGSDAAGVKTKATRVDGGWLVNGQKVWTSGAHQSGMGFATVRTNPDVPKHEGITMMAIDMHADGVEVRPLRQTNGGAEFNEVFFNDVFVPDDDVVGPVDGGWTVARATLGNESVSIGSGGEGLTLPAELLIGPYDAHPERLTGGAARIGRYAAGLQAMGLLNLRSAVRAVTGAGPGPEGAITKLVMSELGHDAAAMLAELDGPDSVYFDGTQISGNMILMHRGMSIAGGTSEIKRNQIGERILGLPRDPLIK
jgi:alkylation response protein AidB-like acyl-CoA dehydrogenase